jgi:hypothetical protein
MTGRGGRRPPTTVQVAGAGGGQGTTTVAMVIAALAARHRPITLTALRPRDVCALAGVPPSRYPDIRSRTVALLPGLSLQVTGPAEASNVDPRGVTAHPQGADLPGSDDPLAGATPAGPPIHPTADRRDPTVQAAATTVMDCGRADQAPPTSHHAGAVRWLVVRGPCYLALRAALDGGWPADGVVLLAEPGRALRAADVSDVLGVPVVAEVSVDPRVARAVDAGLLLGQAARLTALQPLATLVRRHWPLDVAASA